MKMFYFPTDTYYQPWYNERASILTSQTRPIAHALSNSVYRYRHTATYTDRETQRYKHTGMSTCTCTWGGGGTCVSTTRDVRALLPARRNHLSITDNILSQHTYRHTDTQTYRHTDIQAYSHTDIQTHRHTDTQAYRHTDRAEQQRRGQQI